VDPEAISRMQAKLTRDGRGLVSVGQLAHHLSLYPDDIAAAVDNADRLIAPRATEECRPYWPTLYDVLKRAGDKTACSACHPTPRYRRTFDTLSSVTHLSIVCHTHAHIRSCVTPSSLR
jgi:hypothetical protein